MVVIIAKMEKNSNKLEACRLFDTDTRKIKDVSYKAIRKAIVNGEIQIKGFVLADKTNYSTGRVSMTLKKDKGRFSFTKVPSINGEGELLNPEDAKYMAVFGWRGFLERKVYYCVDYKGDVTEMKVNDFIESVKSGVINGASISIRTGDAILSSELENEV